MFVLTDIRNAVVYLASERPVPVRVNEEKGEWEECQKELAVGYFDRLGNVVLGRLDVDVVEVLEEHPLPEDFLTDKYKYTEEKGFYFNESWVELPKPQEQVITELEDKLNNLLLEKAESELEIDERLSKIELGLA